MQVQPTTPATTKYCSRCKSNLPLTAFGSHNYCRDCYRAYMRQWKARQPVHPDHARREKVRASIAGGRCAICTDSPARMGKVCSTCFDGLQMLGLWAEDFDERISNLVDLHNHVFNK